VPKTIPINTKNYTQKIRRFASNHRMNAVTSAKINRKTNLKTTIKTLNFNQFISIQHENTSHSHEAMCKKQVTENR